MPGTIFCSHCGAQNTDDDLFCVSCGKKLAVPSAEEHTAPSTEKQIPDIASRSRIAFVTIIIVAALLLIAGFLTKINLLFGVAAIVVLCYVVHIHYKNPGSREEKLGKIILLFLTFIFVMKYFFGF